MGAAAHPKIQTSTGCYSVQCTCTNCTCRHKYFSCCLLYMVKKILILLFCSQAGTNAQLHTSAEAPQIESERKSSIFPYLLWLTNDRKDGQFYVKIDQKTFYIGSSSSSQDLFLKGVDLTIKAYYTFNLEYHPYLKTTYNFLEILYSISRSNNNSVTKFMNALRNLSTTS